MPGSRKTASARLLWILPLLQVAIAELSWFRFFYTAPIRHDIYWRFTFDLFCAGLNAPADHMNFIIDGLKGFRGGLGWGNVQYMLLVGAFWFLVARKIHIFQLLRAGQPVKASAPEKFVDILLILFGLDMLLTIYLHNMIFTPSHSNAGVTSNFIGDILRQGLFFLWSLALIVVPAATLFTALNGKTLQGKQA